MQTIVDYGRHTRLLGLMLALAVVLMVLPATAQNQIIELTPGTAKVLTLDRPFATVIIGDAGKDIAEVTTVEKEKDTAGFTTKALIVVTGKKAGATNLILLDNDRNEVFNASIIVSGGAKAYDGTFSTRR